MPTAVNIKTENWNHIITTLMEAGWEMTHKYNGFDAGIDYYYVILKHRTEVIEFGWNNWFEGEITTTKEQFELLTNQFAMEFDFGVQQIARVPGIKLSVLRRLINKLIYSIEKFINQFKD